MSVLGLTTGQLSLSLMEINCVLFRESLSGLLELAKAKAESEQLARQKAEDRVSRRNKLGGVTYVLFHGILCKIPSSL